MKIGDDHAKSVSNRQLRESRRQALILELIDREALHSQEQLVAGSVRIGSKRRSHYFARRQELSGSVKRSVRRRLSAPGAEMASPRRC